MINGSHPWEPEPRTRHPVMPAYTYRGRGPEDAMDPIWALAAAWDGVACSGHRPVDTLDLDVCPVCRYRGVTDVEWRRDPSPPVYFYGEMLMRPFEAGCITVEPCGCFVDSEMWCMVATQETGDIHGDSVVSEGPLWVWKRQT